MPIITTQYYIDEATKPLNAEIESLRQEVAELKEDKLDLRKQVNYRCADVQRLESKLAIAIEALEVYSASKKVGLFATLALTKIKGE
jgi:phage shock protein A